MTELEILAALLSELELLHVEVQSLHERVIFAVTSVGAGIGILSGIQLWRLFLYAKIEQDM